MEKYKDERGAVMLEATYCILLAIIVFMFLMSFGFFLYQKAMVRIVANEVAEEVVQTYKLRDVTDSAAVTSHDISGIGKYRYLFNNADKLESINQDKAYLFTDVRLSKTSLAQKKGGLNVSIDTVVDDIGRRHYEVTVSQRYTFLLGGLLSVIGQEEVQQIETVAYVESVDVLNYINTIKATKYGINLVKKQSGILRTVNSAISFWHSIMSM